MRTCKESSDVTILVAEDDDFSFFYFEEVLRKYNYKVIRAVNGKEAVELVKKNKNIDLILMDILMPLMDGNEATNRIRELRKDLPIIVQTAYIVPDDHRKYIHADCNELLVKPITASTLLSVVDHYISAN